MSAARSLNLLFACTANVCRSPLAAGLMARHAREFGADVRVASAGLDREIRARHPLVASILAEHRVELGSPESQPLTDHLVDGADVILVMTGEHARHLVGRFPAVRAKVFVLDHLVATIPLVEPGEGADAWLARVREIRRDYSGDDVWDIDDPIDLAEPEFRAVGSVIDNATSWLAQVIAVLPG